MIEEGFATAKAYWLQLLFKSGYAYLYLTTLLIAKSSSSSVMDILDWTVSSIKRKVIGDKSGRDGVV